MGNSESTYDDTRDVFPYQPPYAGSSMEPHSRSKQKTTHIADNYDSVEQVLIIP